MVCSQLELLGGAGVMSFLHRNQTPGARLNFVESEATIGITDGAKLSALRRGRLDHQARQFGLALVAPGYGDAAHPSLAGGADIADRVADHVNFAARRP